MRWTQYLTLTALAALLLSGSSRALGGDGWLFSLRPSNAVFLLDTDVEQIRGDIYRTEDPDALQALDEAGMVAYLEPDYPVELCGGVLNDQLSMVDMAYPRSAGIQGEGVRVGIVDSGLNDHADLAGAAVAAGYNYCGGGEDTADTSDNVGHGTFVAGILAAQTGGAGEPGMAPAVELVPLKCFDGRTGKTSDVIKAIYGGVDSYGCDVLNMSLGLTEDSAYLRQAVEYAAEKGTLLVAAVGNLRSASTGDDPLLYPAAYEAVTGVGAVDSGGAVAKFSYQNDSVWVMAPGVSVTGLSYASEDGWRTGEGTSYSAPVVAGAAALARSLDPSLDNETFQDLIRRTAVDLGEQGYDNAYGWGLLDVSALLLALRNDWKRNELCCFAPLGLPPGTRVVAVAAACGPDGRQTDLSIEMLEADENGAVWTSLPLEKDGAVRVCLMLLDAAYSPLREAWSYASTVP